MGIGDVRYLFRRTAVVSRSLWVAYSDAKPPYGLILPNCSRRVVRTSGRDCLPRDNATQCGAVDRPSSRRLGRVTNKVARSSVYTIARRVSRKQARLTVVVIFHFTHRKIKQAEYFVYQHFESISENRPHVPLRFVNSSCECLK